jgi:Recombination endonuclease VII
MPWANPEDRRRYFKKYYREKRYKWIESAQRRTPEQKAHAAKFMRDYAYRTQYSITTEDYERMLIEQNGVCGICLLPPPANRRLAVDHCHRSGAVRKLLCTKCNMALGWYEKYGKDIERYLEK